MNKEQIAEKLAKALETVTKKEATLVKYKTKLVKIQNKILAKGFKLDELPANESDRWDYIDLRMVESDIADIKRAIEERKEIAKNWQEKLEKATSEEESSSKILKSFPEIFREYMNKIVTNWDENDAYRFKTLKKEYLELGYNKFCKEYGKSAYSFIACYDKDKSHNDNVRTAEGLLINLWNRISEKVGEVKEWTNLKVTMGNQYEGAVINGIVIGTLGKVKVESIFAGGYHIQKLHVRTLVTEI